MLQALGWTELGEEKNLMRFLKTSISFEIDFVILKVLVKGCPFAY
jgi:hypothetical protein